MLFSLKWNFFFLEMLNLCICWWMDAIIFIRDTIAAEPPGPNSIFCVCILTVSVNTHACSLTHSTPVCILPSFYVILLMGAYFEMWIREDQRMCFRHSFLCCLIRALFLCRILQLILMNSEIWFQSVWRVFGAW